MVKDDNSQLILALIKEDLKCSKLVLGLSELGLEAGKYHLEISAIVFDLMTFKDVSDDLLDIYFNFMDKSLSVEDIETPGILERLALELYTTLLAEKKIRESEVENG